MKRLVLIVLLIALALLLCPLAFAAPFRPECGVEAYENLLMQYAMLYPGTAIWPLDDAAGVLSARELTGVYPGTPSATGVTFNSPGPIVSGEMAKAAAFNGTSGYVTSTYVPITMAGAFTVSLWVNGAGQNAKYFFGNRSTSSTTLYFLIGSDSTTPYTKLRVSFCSNQGNVVLNNVVSTTAVLDSTWHMVTFAANNGTAALYIDGVLDATNYNFTPTGTFSPNICGIGANVRSTVGGWFAGSIADCMVLPFAITATDAYSLWAGATKGL